MEESFNVYPTTSKLNEPYKERFKEP